MLFEGGRRYTGERGMGVYLPAIASGVALVFCFPILDLYPLAFVALVPFLVSLWEMKPAEAFKAGVFLGVFYFFGTQYWIYHSVHHYGGLALVPSIAVVMLLALYQSLYAGVFGMLFSVKIRSTPLPALLLAPVFWVVLELVRSYLFTGFPWSSIGYTQYKFLSFIQFADITGVYGVSFMVVAVNGAVADLFIAKKRRRQMPLFNITQTLAGQGLLLLLLVSAVAYGFYRLGEDRGGAPVRISVVQGNIPQDMKWNPSHQKEVMKTYRKLTAASTTREPALIVWPETAVPFYFGRDQALTRDLLDFQKGLDSYLLFGAITVKGGGGLANSAILVDPSGTINYVYDKIHLVPFGEYVPLQRVLFFIDKLVVGIGDYVPGKEHLRAETPFGDFATLVCYEIIFPGLVRKFYKDGGDYILTITNDAWFGDTAGPYQHFSMAVLRAVENRKPVIRAANTGVSGFIDSNGRIVGSSPLFTQAVLTEYVAPDGTRSFYSRFGDLFAYLCTVVSVVLLVNIRRR